MRSRSRSYKISNHTKSQTTEEPAEGKRICFAWAKHWGQFHFAAIRRERRVAVWCVSVAYATLMPCLPVPLPLPPAAAFFGRLFGGGLREILARHMQSIWSTYGRRPGIRLAYAEHRVRIAPEFSANYKVRPDAKKNFRPRLGYSNLSWTGLIITALTALQKVELKPALTSWFPLTIILKVNNWIVKAFQFHVI